MFFIPFAKNTDYKVFAILALTVVVFTAIVNGYNTHYFKQFLDPINPLVAIITSVIAGFLILNDLSEKKRFYIFRGINIVNILLYTLLIIIFALLAILVDLLYPFPKNINIPFPQSLMFYPAIAFFVEVLLHLVPLALLLRLLPRLLESLKSNRVLWVAISITALIEPTYQMMNMWADPLEKIVVVWISLLLFNVIQLLIFKKFDFISMYGFRLGYYAIWHVVWGYYRLELLF